MRCYIDSVVTAQDVATDIKLLIPDAGLRRRMSRVIKSAVTTAVECVGGTEGIDALDAIITATGWGCLADSEKFLRNMIVEHEQLLNPTPFIQSTFNTVGGQIALLRHNHCYNVTYVNRSHSFEDALLDAMMRIADGESCNVLVGAFDEQTPSQHRIMERMGAFRTVADGEGAVFARLTAQRSEQSVAQVTAIDFLCQSLTVEQCRERYATRADATVVYNGYAKYGLFPTSAAYTFAEAVRLVQQGESEVVVYNEYFGAAPAVFRVQCIG
ncbi:MAG: beta-ketoacyl synthase chain length factor [Alistipes sp.]|nr:beta-ketoacyl synthase chain length factor [Alistipes sp.]